MSDPMRDPTDFALTTSPPDDDKHLYISKKFPPNCLGFIGELQVLFPATKILSPKYYGLQVKSNRTY